MFTTDGINSSTKSAKLSGIGFAIDTAGTKYKKEKQVNKFMIFFNLTIMASIKLKSKG